MIPLPLAIRGDYRGDEAKQGLLLAALPFPDPITAKLRSGHCTFHGFGPAQTMLETSKPLHRSAVRVALGVAFILSLPLVAMLLTDDVVWSLADFVVAGVLLATIGVALELAVRKAGNLAAALGVAALGVAAAVFGGADDAPGLVLLGILLIVSACALGVRIAQRSR
jgi:hypothetical protein